MFIHLIWVRKNWQNAEENDIWYYKGEAFRGLGNEQQAIDCFTKQPLVFRTTTGFLYNDQQPDKIFYQGLAWRALGREIRRAVALTN